jgi:hypothetical protein
MTRPDSASHHRDWLALVAPSGPFLSLPVLRRVWPSLDAVEKETLRRLRARHAAWVDDQEAGQTAWVEHVLCELLGWGELLHSGPFPELSLTVAEHDTTIDPTYALVEPGLAPAAENVRLLVQVCPAGQQPTARIHGDAWAATPVDRLAMLCRARKIPLGLVTDGRWWVLLHAPRRGATATAVFDAVTWPESADRTVLRAFVSLLNRRRFFGVPESDRPAALFAESEDSQEEITEALGVQVRQAVELLVAALGRIDALDRRDGGRGLHSDGKEVSAHDVYRGAVTVMMRIVFLLFAEERRLLPADNDLYAAAYSAGRLCDELEAQAREGSEEELEHSSAAWHRLLALFDAIHNGIKHPLLHMHAHDGSLFNPDTYAWLPLTVDDRTVLHMLRSVLYVEVGSGRARERRALSFRTLDVEQIGYVYEGLLSFDGFRARDVTVGLVGKAGAEEEVLLTDLEAIAARESDVDGLAAALAERYKGSGIGSKAALAKRLAPLEGSEREEARKRLLAVTAGDYALAERLLPFVGIIRDDLLGLPTVILPGALFVTESSLRKTTGTHYTPRELAEEVVEGALEPLVYRVGPLETADKDKWEPKSSEEILALKVADIACGSAAFLVAAARYLAGHLIAAWAREGRAEAQAHLAKATDYLDADADPIVVEARREIIEHCLYGVDINPMAVEMAKLSLWLVSMDPERPFTFVDDRLVAGDSLLGIGNLAALPAEAGQDLRLQRELAQAAELRRQIAGTPDTDEGVQRKHELLGQIETLTARATAYADLVSGSRLAGTTAGRDEYRRIMERVATLSQRLANGEDPDLVRETADEWLATDEPQRRVRRPLHWPLVFPEVFADDKGGFDAIIGNPPFLGGQRLTGSLGTAYREYLVGTIGRGARGSADLVAYFALRAHDLLNEAGQTGLIATNTLAQGDTREVGLDQIVAEGTTIRQAIKSRPWPSASAALEFCAVWTSRFPLAPTVLRVADGVPVREITAALTPQSRAAHQPYRLSVNANLSFIGSYILGMGFTMTPDDAAALIAKDARNQDVLFPYLNGQDLNSRPDCSASRWVINFHDWPEARAKTYPDCYGQVLRLVKPERDANTRKARRERWWQFAERAPNAYRAIAKLERVVVITRVSKTVLPAMVSTGQVISEAVVVFATDDTAMLALLSSAPHYWWTLARASSMRTDIRYTPSDVFETLPLPPMTEELRRLGDRLDVYRRDEVMLARQAGLTATYNLVNNPRNHDADIVELRRIHRDIDVAVCQAYGWDDLVAQGLDHDFHDLGREVRYTIGPAVRQEILDRLLELNHERYAAEVAAGLHDKKKGTRSTQDGEPAPLFTLGETLDEEPDDDE